MSRAKSQTEPLRAIFRFLQSKTRVQIWLYEQPHTRLEGKLIGFDEFMNVVLDDAEEVDVKKKGRKALGRIMLKGDNITLVCAAPVPGGAAPPAAAAAAGGGAGVAIPA